jgi:hypothetical protein
VTSYGRVVDSYYRIDSAKVSQPRWQIFPRKFSRLLSAALNTVSNVS